MLPYPRPKEPPARSQKGVNGMTFSEKVRALRTELGYTQAELADVAGISEGAVFGYEKGKFRPRRSTLNLLAAALRVSNRYLSDDDCTDPLTDIEQDSFFQRAQEEYRRKVREGR